MDVDATDFGISDEKVLVTGGCGFIGRHLVDALAAENEVVILDDLTRADPEYIIPEAEVVVDDVRHLRAVEDVPFDFDVIFHLAAFTEPAGSGPRAVRTYDVNTRGTLEVLNLADEDATTVVFASDAAVYGTPEVLPVSEDDPLEPATPYALSKRQGEAFFELHGELYDLDAVAVRLFSVYGPRHHDRGIAGEIDSLVRDAVGGDALWVHGDGDTRRDFLHVSDAVRAMLMAAAGADGYAVYNVASGEGRTLDEVVELVDELNDRDLPIEYTDPLGFEIPDRYADVSRIADELGFEPAVPFREGLEELIALERESQDDRTGHRGGFEDEYF